MLPALVQKMLDGVFLENTSSPVINLPRSGAVSSTHTAVFDDTAQGGEVTVEGAHDPAYAGRWTPIAVLAWAADTPVVSATTTQLFKATRHRVSSTVLAGTVTTQVSAVA